VLQTGSGIQLKLWSGGGRPEQFIHTQLQVQWALLHIGRREGSVCWSTPHLWHMAAPPYVE
jgi:hypothetical protein